MILSKFPKYFILKNMILLNSCTSTVSIKSIFFILELNENKLFFSSIFSLTFKKDGVPILTRFYQLVISF